VNDPWWKRRRKKKDPWFNDIYDELERLGDLIDETMQKAFKSSSKDESTKSNRFKSCSVKLGPDGKPRFQKYNNQQQRQTESEVIDDPEPLVDIIEEKDTLVVLAAIPGVNKDDIDLRLTENNLTFSVDSADFEWYDELTLPARVNPKEARASYKNGVLEIKVKKLAKSFRAGRISLKK
jgi:HSP20 family protein